jgi:hypothetical protein
MDRPKETKKMNEYDVVLKDADGFDICTDLVEGLTAAKARAKYLLSDDHAKVIGTTHAELGTHKAEVQATRTGAVLWDAFR